MKSIVYWIRYIDHNDPYSEGYIGVTNNLDVRHRTHLRNKRVPENTMIDILFEGSRKECFSKELEYRPKPKIGWNNAVGGSHGWKIGFKHSDKTKQKLKEAWSDERKKEAAKLRSELNKSLIGQKRPKQSKSISGKNNPMFNKKHTGETKEKISKKLKGKSAPNKTEIYCIHCRKRASMSVLKKYHGIGKKNCVK
jgi:hypothetical protein